MLHHVRRELLIHAEGMHVIISCLHDIQLQGRVQSSFLLATQFSVVTLLFPGQCLALTVLFSRVLLLVFLYFSPPLQADISISFHLSQSLSVTRLP